MIEEIPPIEDKGGLDHRLINSFVVQLRILRPFRENGNRMGIPGSSIRVRLIGDLVSQVLQVLACIIQGIGIGHHDIRFLLKQGAADCQGGRLARVAGVGFKGSAKQRNAFACHCVEHGGDHIGRKARLLVLIHEHDLFPVSGHFRQAVVLA